ncbi:MAG TPA: hypothetical protein DCK76_05450 [Desulfotomaculum sp.]|nr:MAG: hypothetical protein XD84_2176 [Desulfotomaculum sp. 46_80]HAG10821.1 hypothetical protein [Desulfotomaculum sp.]HBY05277.1 hypothetical protein [Desulfotomaculum sp.]
MGEILKEYPDLEAKDIKEALEFTAETVREKQLPLVGIAVSLAQLALYILVVDKYQIIRYTDIQR